jgi:uncharacterized protein YndB with AHSA1/START domain
MERLNFLTNINAPRETVWKVLWQDQYYRKWTSVFSETSYAETDWREGSKVLFLDAQRNGMVSRIASVRPNEFMSFEHLGEVKNGIEDTESDKVKGWAGAFENYTLSEVNGSTELKVEIDMNPAFTDYFQKTFPQALANIKSLAEASGSVLI